MYSHKPHHHQHGGFIPHIWYNLCKFYFLGHPYLELYYLSMCNLACLFLLLKLRAFQTNANIFIEKKSECFIVK